MVILSLTQAAKNFGDFRDIEFCTKKKTGIFAIFGINKSLLCHQGPLRLLFQSIKRDEYGCVTIVVQELVKNKILDHYKLNYDQIKLLSVLNGKFYTNDYMVSKIFILRKAYLKK